MQLCHSPTRRRPSSCFALLPLSMPSYHDAARGEREVRGGAALGRVSASGQLGRRVEQLARGDRELEAARSGELRVARHSGRHVAACSGWHTVAGFGAAQRERVLGGAASVCECTPLLEIVTVQGGGSYCSRLAQLNLPPQIAFPC
jgi:hypothetical protein